MSQIPTTTQSLQAINTPNIDYRLVDKLFSKEVLNQRGKKTFLIEQNTEEKS